MTQKSVFAAIVGRSNVGKSSLLNKILGQKIAIVSSKPQTTRTRIMGVLTKDETQFVFIDTPGLHKPKNALGETMVKAVKDGMTDVDVAVLVIDAAPHFKVDKNNIPSAETELIERFKAKKIPAILVINKIDLLKDKEEILNIIGIYNAEYEFDAVVPLSAKTGSGVDILVGEIEKHKKDSPHFFPDDELTDQSEKVMVAEIIREKLLRCLSKEIPHGIAVDIEKFYERDTSEGEPILEVEAVIYCEKASHKGIIIGKGGAALKKIGSIAREDIEKFFGIRANLKLWIKVKEGWRNNRGMIHTFGLDIKEN
ncbi:MAG TPA: GTPase Era [Ruminococcaceae bacterium]|nr:GTPase Era [Oscillospiraceae bacterium]